MIFREGGDPLFIILPPDFFFPPHTQSVWGGDSLRARKALARRSLRAGKLKGNKKIYYFLEGAPGFIYIFTIYYKPFLSEGSVRRGGNAL